MAAYLSYLSRFFFNINIYVYKGVKYAENILTFYNDVIQL